MDVIANVSWIAVAVAAISSFLVSGVWYAVLFKDTWMDAAGMTQEQVDSGDPGKIFGFSFLLQFVSAAGLALFIGREADLMFGLLAGMSVGLLWVSTALGIMYLFEHRPLRLWLVNGGNQIVVFTLMGAVLGAWP